jgi:hypothetical protein
VLGRYAGGSGRQHLVEQYRTNRNVIRFAASQWNHPFRLQAATRAYADALTRQDALFTRQAVDDITDAMRHANASALVVDRLVRKGARPDRAAEFMRRLGLAHEADSELTGVHRATSEAMDLHNNELGIAVGLDHLARSGSSAAGEQALEGAVLRALADGRALVLDSKTAPPRASTADELRAVLRDPSLV